MSFITQIPAEFNTTRLTGVVPEAAPSVAEAWFHSHSETVGVCVLSNIRQIEIWLAHIRTVLRELRPNDQHLVELVSLPPQPDDDPDEPIPARVREEMECDRLAALTLLADFAEKTPANKHRLLVLTTPAALFSRCPPREELGDREIRLKAGDIVDFQLFQQRLATELDYDAEAICERPGQFAVRGGIIDLYPLNGNTPVRLDFFGDELESLRAFDPTTQRSTETLAEVVIAGRSNQSTSTLRETNIFEYFGGPVCWMFHEPGDLAEGKEKLFQSFENIRQPNAGFARLIEERRPAADSWLALTDLETDCPLFANSANVCSLPAENMEFHLSPAYAQAIGMDRTEEEIHARRQLLLRLREWQAEGQTVLAVLPNEAETQRLHEWMATEPALKDFNLPCHNGWLRAGFHIAASKKKTGFLPRHFPEWTNGFAVVTDRELFGRNRQRREDVRRRRLPQKAAVDHLLDFSELADGDYLVHLSHGICQYRGLAKMDIKGRNEEVISVEFDEKLTLHVPLQEAHLLTRYVGLNKSSPKLSRLGSNSWEKTRRAAEAATVDLAASLLQTQAQRSHGPGHAFAPDTHWQQSFEASFPHSETRDQMRAIIETKADMEKPRPMDRLICGDVGYGKTEVAIRAAFKAVMDGFQVAILVPTTVLAQQHYDTFRERMAEYPVTVEMLSRFRKPSQQAEVIRQLAQGRIDILVGTHRMLSGDVHFRRLGLLVIDEEHRFGVRHKERMKSLKADVDVVMMSATPIPRTLHMALMGARDMSVIETAPADRLPIETMVRSYDIELVRKAIQRELDREGQVFYLHNRVQSIESVALRLRELFPKARIDVGHGQMPENTLEKVMTRFVAGQTDVLVCTTIIENGIDIPNCNTMIIEGADRFGLSQLYQLRGRVGRFRRQAYAYLLLHRHARVIDIARQRLSALRQHNQLGAGFKIAMRDLELRGAGNLLGAQQSGHIAGVGFDLYCQLLRQSVARLKGDVKATHIRSTVNLDFIYQGSDASEADDKIKPVGNIGFHAIKDAELEDGYIEPVPACFPSDYIAETRLRIDFYRQLAMASTLDEVKDIAAALQDRFGKPPRPTDRLIAIARIRTLAEKAGIISVVTEGNRLKCLRASGKRDDYLKIGSRFPRLTSQRAHLRLREIEQFIGRHCPK